MIVDIHEAETRLPQLVQRALAGEKILLANDKDPVIQLTPIQPRSSRPVVFGAWKGKGWIADDFDAALPDDLLDAFDGREPKEEP